MAGPLQDQDPNLPRTSSSTTKTLQAHTRDGSSISLPATTPSIVQSMLKTTTEVGNIGQFAVRPSRIPRSSSQLQSNTARSAFLDASATPGMRRHRTSESSRHGRRPHGFTPVHSMNGLSPHTEVAQGMYQNRRSGHRSRHRGDMPPDGFEGPPHLRPHRSLMTFRSHRELHNMHSSSSMGQDRTRRTPRHARPGPGISGAHSYHYGFANGVSGVGGYSTAGSSPASMLHPRSVHRVYRPDVDGSMSSLDRMPSPAASTHYLPGGRSIYGQRILTPRIGTPGSASFSYVRTASRNSIISQSAFPRSSTSSTVQHYYDYTESFIEEDNLSQIPANFQVTSLNTTNENGAVVAISEGPLAKSPFSNAPGSSARPIELPTEHNRRQSEHSVQSSRHSTPREIPPRTSSIGAVLRLSISGSQRSKEPWNSSETALQSVLPTDLAQHASIASQRNCTASPLSAFFQSATRSPRDLATLAARVHSPVSELHFHKEEDAQDGTELEEIVVPVAEHGLGSGSKQLLAHAKATHDVQTTDLSSWQFPNRGFKPYCSQTSAPLSDRRPYTSSGIPSQVSTEVISPMPERPMSSQSRKRFSRILDIQEDFSGIVPCTYKTPFTGSRLEKVDEASNPASSLRLSLSPLTPFQKIPTLQSNYRDSSQRFTEETQLSHNTTPDKSTVESLLDEHIECLGLQPGSDESSYETATEQDSTSLAGGSQSTIRLPNVHLFDSQVCTRRPATSSSSRKHSSLASAERQMLMPRRLFASLNMRERSSNVRELPQALFLAPPEQSERPSFGWQTLNSSTQAWSLQSLGKPSMLSGELADVDTSTESSKLKIRRRSDLSLTSSDLLSDSVDLLTEASGQTRTCHHRSKSELLTGQMSHHRRKLKIRLKTQHKSYSHGDLAGVGSSAVDVHVEPPQSSHEWVTTDTSETPIGQAGVDTESAVPYQQLAGQETSNVPLTTFSPTWSNIVAAMPEPVKRSVDIPRRTSISTHRSRRSNASHAEPLNSTRLATRPVQLGENLPQLKPPEFGTNLTAADLTLSMPGAEPPSVTHPMLRETKSFFSDDSSVKPHWQSMRKGFKLQSLRHLFPGSPGGTVLATEASERVGFVQPSKSCPKNDRTSSEEPILTTNDTVAMTDFAYRRKKVLGRFRDWWKRQCMQQAFSIKKKKAVDIPGGLLV